MYLFVNDYFLSHSPQNFCRDIFSSSVFSDCRGLVSIDSFVEVCMKDLCHCNGSSGSFCLCKTIAEYSRQCVHAGGRPEEWRTEYFCRKYAMFMPCMAHSFSSLSMFVLPLCEFSKEDLWLKHPRNAADLESLLVVLYSFW